MGKQFNKFLRKSYNKLVSSIAFYPALIAIGFLIISYLMLNLDFSETGKQVKTNYNWIRLKDASTARSIVSTIAGGIISLMVFSFSMVMILLNQAASQMSNRMLEGMIGNRFQQLVLGAYIGTIVYALFLLSTIRDLESGIYVPALSIYLLLLITIGDIFLFIYFLHYVTQSVKFETIISRVHHKTYDSLAKNCRNKKVDFVSEPKGQARLVLAEASGYYQGFDKRNLLEFAVKNDLIIRLLHPPGSFIMRDQAIAHYFSAASIDSQQQEELHSNLDIYNGEPIDNCFFYGFHQLTEVALKALSPGINDPQTAVIALHALADLLLCRLSRHPNLTVADNNDHARIILSERSFKDLFVECINPIWDYGADDRYIQNTMFAVLIQLISAASNEEEITLLVSMQAEVTNKRKI
ncbi:DUF2254 domain-containing protein [Pedobacter jejuensis]|uniref:DUF2254 domain-containing protein n=2 Tax=Pedobacter jejuensis TaxID=1268550 RepID=A0A3N0BNI0_9SPHI|nr:DUF2254 domain-containing protein [Pedobacter jejuensis]